jgi:hypothetical protein
MGEASGDCADVEGVYDVFCAAATVLGRLLVALYDASADAADGHVVRTWDVRDARRRRRIQRCRDRPRLAGRGHQALAHPSRKARGTLARPSRRVRLEDAELTIRRP